MKILEMLWFTQAGTPSTLGIIVGEDEITGEAKAYLGTAQGYDEEADAKHILETGAKFYPGHLSILRRHLK